jgi:pyruvate formate lyase activating enzyme
MEQTARYLSGEAEGIVRCDLCPHRCAISNGHFGACGVRGNKNGKGLLPFYGNITALAMDPIEKKPLFHFRPGSMILSAGFSGCNLRCPFCQNYHISQSPEAPAKKMQASDIISAALHEGTDAIAYTYSEPLVHAEFLLDCMALAHRHGIANVLVTNGCANAEATQEILSLTDAANIDLKCFSAETYSSVLGGGSNSCLETILNFIRLACMQGVHVEITTLVVPGLNDSPEELDNCIDFIASLNDEIKIPASNKSATSNRGEIPWHLSAYHPDYRWNAPPTNPDFLLETKKRAEKKIAFVYTGNIQAEKNNTLCLGCGEILIRRRGYSIETPGLAVAAKSEKFFRCAKCGEKTSVSC